MGKKIVVKPGHKFGRLTVIKELFGVHPSFGRYFLCNCTCGKIKSFRFLFLRSGKTKSCGCYRRENAAKILRKIVTTHGKKGAPVYTSWQNMWQRCTNKKHKSYNLYSSIKIDKDWKKFENFYRDMGDRPKGTTLDRINNLGPYCKENCRWATSKQQILNRRNTIFVTFKGKTFCAYDWSILLGGKSTLVSDRIRDGWDPIKAVSTPPRKWGCS